MKFQIFKRAFFSLIASSFIQSRSTSQTFSIMLSLLWRWRIQAVSIMIFKVSCSEAANPNLMIYTLVFCQKGAQLVLYTLWPLTNLLHFGSAVLLTLVTCQLIHAETIVISQNWQIRASSVESNPWPLFSYSAATMAKTALHSSLDFANSSIVACFELKFMS